MSPMNPSGTSGVLPNFQSTVPCPDFSRVQGNIVFPRLAFLDMLEWAEPSRLNSFVVAVLVQQMWRMHWMVRIEFLSNKPLVVHLKLWVRVPNQPSPEVHGSNEGTQDALLRALQIAVTGERKFPPSWGGAVESLRPWLKSLALWEMDNHLPRSKWVWCNIVSNSGKVCSILGSRRSCGNRPVFFSNQAERPRNESFSTYIAAKEVARQELEAHVRGRRSRQDRRTCPFERCQSVGHSARKSGNQAYSFADM